MHTEDLLKDGEPTGNQEVTDKPTEFSIEVRGVKPTTSKDSIIFYFGGRYGANNDVVKMVYKEEENMYILWFKEEDAIERVLKKTHRIDGQTLYVNKYFPPPPPKPVPKYDNKVFITNISSTTTKDGLDNFVEAISKASGWKLLKLHTVAVTDCVVVTGFQDTTSSDMLEFYFDNKKRSGVEGARDIKLIKEKGTCLVYFIEPNSALEVCKKEHRVQVQVYYECLGQAAIDNDRPKFKALKSRLLNF